MCFHLRVFMLFCTYFGMLPPMDMSCARARAWSIDTRQNQEVSSKTISINLITQLCKAASIQSCIVIVSTVSVS